GGPVVQPRLEVPDAFGAHRVEVVADRRVVLAREHVAPCGLAGGLARGGVDAESPRQVVAKPHLGVEEAPVHGPEVEGSLVAESGPAELPVPVEVPALQVVAELREAIRLVLVAVVRVVAQVGPGVALAVLAGEVVEVGARREAEAAAGPLEGHEPAQEMPVQLV